VSGADQSPDGPRDERSRPSLRWISTFAVVFGSVALLATGAWLSNARGALDDARAETARADETLEATTDDLEQATSTLSATAQDARDALPTSESFVEISETMVETAARQVDVYGAIVDADARGDLGEFNRLVAEVAGLRDDINDLAALSNTLLG
jgi:ABC-type transporter Mla subunit MlaD